MFDSHFSINNIPFGIASSAIHPHRSVATRIGDKVVFLDELAKHGLLLGLTIAAIESFSQPTLNVFMALPRSSQQHTRAMLRSLLSSNLITLPFGSTARLDEATLHLPVSCGDFTDFSCSMEHVLNAGEAIQGKRRLPPGFFHFPIGYEGRSSSIVVSGTPVVRPMGQFRNALGEVIYGASEQMDYELEIACIVGKPSQLGAGVQSQDADDHIFGFVLLNDWSARDIQGLEMDPLGPLNGKSFMTSISPWVVVLDALKPFETPMIPRHALTAPYLHQEKTPCTYDVAVQADMIVDGHSSTICKSGLKSLYWSFRDLVAHQTSNGCNLNTGDVLATGTISGDTRDSHGCLLEMTKGGRVHFTVDGAFSRTFLRDGDIILISAYAGDGVGFGECVGQLVRAHNT